MTSRVLIVGGTGKVGRALVDDLRSEAAAGRMLLRIATRSPGSHAALTSPGVELHKLDLNDCFASTECAAALASCDALFLLTGYTVDMLRQCKAVLDTAKLAGVRHVVHVGVHGDDATFVPHIGWHQYIERYIEGQGFAWTHLRPNWFMQNLLRFTAREEDGSLVIRNYLPPNLKVSWIDARDIGGVGATVLRDLTRFKACTYSLASQALDFSTVAEVFGRSLHVGCRYEEIDLDAFRTQRLKAGRDPKYEESIAIYYQGLRSGLIPECADTFDVATLLDHQPATMDAFAIRDMQAHLSR